MELHRAWLLREASGQSRFRLESLMWTNEAGGFVPVSLLNQLRRDVVIADVEARWANIVPRSLRRFSISGPCYAATGSAHRGVSLVDQG